MRKSYSSFFFLLSIVFLYSYQGIAQTNQDSVEVLIKKFVKEGHQLGKKSNLIGKKEKLDSAIFLCYETEAVPASCAYAMRHQANIFMRLGDNEQAVKLLRNAIKKAKMAGRLSEQLRSETDLCGIIRLRGNKAAAIVCYEDLLKKNPTGVIQVLARANLWQTHFENGQVKKSIKALNQILNGSTPPKSSTSLAIAAGVSKTLAEGHAHLKNFDRAASYYQMAIDYARITYGPNSRELAKTYISMGENLLVSKEQFSEALDTFQQALNIVLPNFNSNDIYSNPPVELLKSENTIFQALEAKAKTFYLQYLKSQEGRKGLISALDCYESILRIENLLRQQFRDESASFVLQQASHKRVEQGIKIAYTLFQATNDTQYLNRAFALSEKSRAVLLKEALREIAAKTKGLIPDSLYNKERHFRQRLALLKASVLPDTDEQANQIQSLEQSLIQLENTLKKEHPNYHKIKYQEESINLSTIRQELMGQTNDRAFIEYFVGEKNSYAFVITRDDFHCIPLQVNQSSLSIIDTFLMETVESIKGEISQYCRLAHQLYLDLFHPIAKQLDLPERITIIPDGQIAYLPFDALLTEQENTQFIKDFSFLLDSHNISMAYSIMELLNASNKSMNFQKKYLGIAPKTFNHHGLNALSNSANEILECQKLFSGDVLLESDATKYSFKTMAPLYQVLHLSTHASAQPKQSYPWISFADSLFYLPEVYTLSLNAELVILSACETGKGENKSGEGILSLSRAYAYANCPSILTTFWNVLDAKTSEIITKYVQQLDEGINKDIAIYEAKKNYLNKANNPDAHPLYWAGFIQIGSLDPLSRNAIPTSYVCSTLWLFAFLLFIFFLHRLYKTKQKA